jgi:hypothetical protein
MCGCAYLTRKFPFHDILSSEQKVGLCAANNASVATSFRLFTSGFHFRFFFPAKLFYSRKANRVSHGFQIIILASSISGYLWLCTPAQMCSNGTATTVQYCNWHRSQFWPTTMDSQPYISLRIFPPTLLVYTYQKWHRALRLGEVRRIGVQHVPQAC